MAPLRETLSAVALALACACGPQFTDVPPPPADGTRLVSGKLVPPSPQDLAEQPVALQLVAVALDAREERPVVDAVTGPAFSPSGNGGLPASFRMALPVDRAYVLFFQSPADGRGGLGRIVARFRFPRAGTGELTDRINGRATDSTAPLKDLDLGTVRVVATRGPNGTTRQVLLGEGEALNPLALNDADGDGVPDLDDGDDDNDLVPDDGDDDANGDGIPDASQSYDALSDRDADGDGIPDVFEP